MKDKRFRISYNFFDFIRHYDFLKPFQKIVLFPSWEPNL
jgi:hypothetical protein